MLLGQVETTFCAQCKNMSGHIHLSCEYHWDNDEEDDDEEEDDGDDSYGDDPDGGDDDTGDVLVEQR